VVADGGKVGDPGQVVTFEIAEELELALQFDGRSGGEALRVKFGEEVVEIVVWGGDDDGVGVHVDGLDAMGDFLKDVL